MTVTRLPTRKAFVNGKRLHKHKGRVLLALSLDSHSLTTKQIIPSLKTPQCFPFALKIQASPQGPADFIQPSPRHPLSFVPPKAKPFLPQCLCTLGYVCLELMGGSLFSFRSHLTAIFSEATLGHPVQGASTPPYPQSPATLSHLFGCPCVVYHYLNVP